MTEDERLHAELRRRSEELEALNAELQAQERARAMLVERLIDVQESERRRIARHLHDELAQTLTGLLMSLDAAEAELGEDRPQTRAQLRRTREIAAASLEGTRRLILDLRPSILDDLGLVPALRWYAETHLAPTGAVVTLRSRGRSRRLDPRIETTIFRIAQELMSNVARHARADNVVIRVSFEPSCLRLAVVDDGIGFDVDAAQEVSPSGAGLGFLGIRERVQILDGRLRLESEPGEGAWVEIEVPLSPADGQTERGRT